MPSSGQGGSWNAEFTTCMRKGFHQHVQGLVPTSTEPSAPLIVGEAVHLYAQMLYETQLIGGDAERCKEEAEFAFHNFLAGSQGHALLNNKEWEADPYLMERAKLARQVLPVWAEGQLARLAAGVERTIAVEVSFSYKLPAETTYGPISDHLRLVTGRIDRVFKRNDPLDVSRLDQVGLTIQDHKATKASSLAYYVRDLLRSDQHLGYVFGWNLARPPRSGMELMHSAITHYTLDARAKEGWEKADEIEYNLIRLGTLSPKSLHRESRPTNTEQLLDYYERLCSLRAELSRLWDKPKEWWHQNTGACARFGEQCAFYRLCEEPHLHANLIAPQEGESEGYAYQIQAS